MFRNEWIMAIMVFLDQKCYMLGEMKIWMTKYPEVGHAGT